MKFPEWAPKTLVDSLAAHRNWERIMTEPVIDKLVDTMMANINIDGCSEKQQEEYREKYLQMFSVFPLDEQIQILEKLLTYPAMKTTWASIGKRVENDYEYQQFWHACQEGIAGYRHLKKRSKTEHKKHFQKIIEYALTLSQMLEETTELYSLPIEELISDDRINQLLVNLRASPSGSDVEKNVNYARVYLSKTIPSTQAVLNAIAIKAIEISEDELLIKKPNSENASIQYFIRKLSGYLENEYGQPLHEVVTVTTGVIFDMPEIGDDRVRKLVKKNDPEDFLFF